MEGRIVAALCAGIFACVPAHGDDVAIPASIRPLLEAHCVACHEGSKPKGGLELAGPIGAGKIDEGVLRALRKRLAKRDMPPADEPERPSLDEYRAFSAAVALAATGKHEAAVERFEAIVARNPHSLSALDELAFSLIAQQRWPRAIEVLLERRRHSPERLSTEQGLVQCYRALGDEARARVHTLRALELLVEIHQRRGEPDKARQYEAILAEARDR